VVTSTKSRLTGERPQQGVTPDSLLALHEAGYRAVLDRIGQGRILDVGCGSGAFGRLLRARHHGMELWEIEPDPVSARAAEDGI